MQTIEEKIRQKAYELGYEKCGIIPINSIEGYAEKFEGRIQEVPESEPFYKKQRRLINPLETYPWAKSVIVLSVPYGKYKVPKEIKGRIAKAYLFDVRVDINTKEYRNRREFEDYMKSLELRIASNEKFGAVGMRWAALQAGIGIIRRNNFLYTESGSWVHLEAWVADKEMELKEKNSVPQCPKGCNCCIEACPTKSLFKPYTMSPTKCISFLTTFGGRNLPEEPLSRSFGACIYGCDICQEACPMNKGKMKEIEEFPGVLEISAALIPENILNMEEDFYREKIQPKFFYLLPEELWKWKVDTLCYMRNNYEDRYKSLIIAACNNQHEKVLEMAYAVCHDLGLK